MPCLWIFLAELGLNCIQIINLILLGERTLARYWCASLKSLCRVGYLLKENFLTNDWHWQDLNRQAEAHSLHLFPSSRHIASGLT